MANVVVSVTEPGFKERLEGKPLEDSGVILHKCGNCGGIHFRHAGYVQVLLPFIRPGADGKRVEMHSEQVKLCVNCKHAFIWVSGQVYDVSEQIDVAAWERTEREAQRTTGPGGQC